MRKTHTTKTDTANTTKGTAKEIMTLVRKYTAEGLSQTQTAARLNASGFTTTRGKPWNQTSVSVLMRSAHTPAQTQRARKSLRRAAGTGTVTRKRTTLSRIFADVATAKFRMPQTRTYLLDLVLLAQGAEQ